MSDNLQNLIKYYFDYMHKLIEEYALSHLLPPNRLLSNLHLLHLQLHTEY